MPPSLYQANVFILFNQYPSRHVLSVEYCEYWCDICALQNPDSESAQKLQEAERLRAAEKFMKIGTGEAYCKGCGYEYQPKKGDPEYPISAGTQFQVSLLERRNKSSSAYPSI